MPLTSEDNLLLQGVRAALSGAPIGVHEFAQSVNWTEFHRTAERHHVGPLVYEAMRDTEFEDRLPQDVRTRLLLEYHRTGMRNGFIHERLADILGEATRRGVDVMLLKGAVLAFEDYARPEHRGLGDIDLLVREHQIKALQEALESSGYHGSVPEVPDRDLPRYAHSVSQLRFTSGKLPPLEVHLRLLNAGVPSATEPAWEDAEPCEFGGVRVFRPSNERFLLHLCLHAQQHTFSMLRLFGDIAVWLRAREIDQERFVFLARQHHLATAAHYALAYTDHLLGLGESESIRKLLRPSAWKRRLFEKLWHDRKIRSLRAQRGPQEAELARAYLFGEAPIRNKARFLWHLLRQPRDWLESGVKPQQGARRRRFARVCRVAWKGLTEV